MEPQQTQPQNQNDIDARIMAERHAAEAYQSANIRVVADTIPQTTQKSSRLLAGIMRNRPILLVAIPLLFLVFIIAVASHASNDKGPKSNIASIDEPQSDDGSLAGDYVVGEDGDTTNTGKTQTDGKKGSTNSSKTPTKSQTNKGSTSSSGSSKTPTKTIKHPQPVVKPPKNPIVIGNPPVVSPPPPPPAPPLKLGTLCLIKASSLTESSGLVASIKHPGVVYTHNDEKGPILAINISSCKTAGYFSVTNFRTADHFPDPEAITIDRTTGKIWLGDIGNGHPGQTSSMTDKDPVLRNSKLAARIIVFSEPSKFSGTISTKKYDITYDNGMQNSEALLVNPKTGQGYIINKYKTTYVYKLPFDSSAHIKSGQAKHISASVVPWVTDATFTNSGKYVLVRYRTTTDAAPTSVVVYSVTSSTSWKKVGTIKVPRVKQGESITVERDGRSFLIGSEGSSSPLVRVALPTKYQ